jgi:hypothetical protein
VKVPCAAAEVLHVPFISSPPLTWPLKDMVISVLEHRTLIASSFASPDSVRISSKSSSEQLPVSFSPFCFNVMPIVGASAPSLVRSHIVHMPDRSTADTANGRTATAITAIVIDYMPARFAQLSMKARLTSLGRSMIR